MRVTAAAPKAAKAVSLTVKADGEDRLRLHNLSPLKGSRKAKTRKGRGYGAGQVSILVPSTESFADAHAVPLARADRERAGLRRHHLRESRWREPFEREP